MGSKLQSKIKMMTKDRERAIRFFWRSGLNTFEIAKRTEMSEAQIYNIMGRWLAQGISK